MSTKLGMYNHTCVILCRLLVVALALMVTLSPAAGLACEIACASHRPSERQLRADAGDDHGSHGPSAAATATSPHCDHASRLTLLVDERGPASRSVTLVFLAAASTAGRLWTVAPCVSAPGVARLRDPVPPHVLPSVPLRI